METTMHGTDRILGRTKMVVKDVLGLIKNGAVVSLGFHKGYEFLLFYSPFDGVCKIAVVSKGREALISVWNIEYRLPKSLAKPTFKRQLRARALQQEYSYAKLSVPFKPKELFDVKIEVYASGRLEYVHTCPSPIERRPLQTDYIRQLRTVLMPITSVVKEFRKRRNVTVHYEFHLINRESEQVVQKALFSHKTIQYYLQAA